MNPHKNKYIALSLTLLVGAYAVASTAINDDTDKHNVIDEVVWVVGDEPIMKSDVEVMRLQAQQEGQRFKGNPDCAIPEQLAVQKLFLHQAAIDSLEVSESEISSMVEQRIDYFTQAAGSRERLEEARKQSISQFRAELREQLRSMRLAEMMKEKIVEGVTVTPSDVRKYFKNMPADSLPYIPTQVEVQIITYTPSVTIEEINRVKDELRSFTERINNGETSFSALAHLYSEDGSARMGGELPYYTKADLDPAFAAVAFNLTDPKKVSKIVESEFGFHIIQLIDKRGERIRVRHILMKPRVDVSAIDAGLARLDSVAADIRADKFSFDVGASAISDDKDTRSNHGLMVYHSPDQDPTKTTQRFKMDELPAEIARVVDTMQVGEISKAFRIINSKGKTQCAIVKLKNRIAGHRAMITEDFQVMQNLVMAKRKAEKLHDWVAKKIKDTYIRVNDKYKDCDFEYEGWIK